MSFNHPEAGNLIKKGVPQTYQESERQFFESLKYKDYQFFKCLECGKHIYANFNLFQKHVLEYHKGWYQKNAHLKPFKFYPTNL